MHYITRHRYCINQVGTLKHAKPAKCVLSVLLRLGHLSANQMCGTKMNLFQTAFADWLYRFLPGRWWGQVSQSGDGRPDRRQSHAPRRPELEPHMDAGGDHHRAARGRRPAAHRASGLASVPAHVHQMHSDSS